MTQEHDKKGGQAEGISHQAVPSNEAVGETTSSTPNSEKQEAPKHNPNRIEKYTKWLTIFTGLYVVISSLQWCSMKESLNLARESLQIDKRAWITIDRFDPQVALTPDIPLKIKVTIRNDGETPALKVSSNSKGFLINMPESLDRLPECPQLPRGNVSATMLGSHQNIHIFINIDPQPANIIENIRSEKQTMTFLLCGNVFYDDIFHDTPIRHTRHCSFYDSKTDGFAACPKGNEAN